eukprot:tig00020553_g10573.t1
MDGKEFGGPQSLRAPSASGLGYSASSCSEAELESSEAEVSPVEAVLGDIRRKAAEAAASESEGLSDVLAFAARRLGQELRVGRVVLRRLVAFESLQLATAAEFCAAGVKSSSSARLQAQCAPVVGSLLGLGRGQVKTFGGAGEEGPAWQRYRDATGARAAMGTQVHCGATLYGGRRAPRLLRLGHALALAAPGGRPGGPAPAPPRPAALCVTVSAPSERRLRTLSQSSSAAGPERRLSDWAAPHAAGGGGGGLAPEPDLRLRASSDPEPRPESPAAAPRRRRRGAPNRRSSLSEALLAPPQGRHDSESGSGSASGSNAGASPAARRRQMRSASIAAPAELPALRPAASPALSPTTPAAASPAAAAPAAPAARRSSSSAADSERGGDDSGIGGIWGSIRRWAERAFGGAGAKPQQAPALASDDDGGSSPRRPAASTSSDAGSAPSSPAASVTSLGPAAAGVPVLSAQWPPTLTALESPSECDSSANNSVNSLKGGQLGELLRLAAAGRPRSPSLAEPPAPGSGSTSGTAAAAAWEISPGDVQLFERVGQGAFADVWRGLWHGTQVAVKKLRTLNVTPQALALFRREVAVLHTLRHPRLVLFLGACSAPSDLFIVFEYLEGGSLDSVLHGGAGGGAGAGLQLEEEGGPVGSAAPDGGARGRLPVRRVLEIASEVAVGMDTIHALGLIHRDLKPGNVLLDASGRAKITDFGLSRVADSAGEMTGEAGSFRYTAPEILLSKKYTSKVDVFSFGVLLWEMATNQVPYGSMSAIQVAMRVMREGPDLPIAPGPACPRALADLIRECVSVDPDVRPPFSTVARRLRALLAQLDSVEQLKKDVAGIRIPLRISPQPRPLA